VRTVRFWPRAAFQPTSGAAARSEKSFFDWEFSVLSRLVYATECNALSLIAPNPALWLDPSRLPQVSQNVAF